MRRVLLVLLDGVILGLLGLYVVAGLEKVPFHGDESSQIFLSRDYHTLFYDGDIGRIVRRGSMWRTRAQYFRTTSGSINTYTMGLAWDLAGYSVTDLTYWWSWNHEAIGGWDQWAWNVRVGNKPRDELLHIARIPSTLFTVLSIVVVHGIARTLTQSRPAAWLAALIYTTTPAILVNGRRATQEGAMLFASALVILIAIRVIRALERPNTGWRKLTGWYLGLGAASGYAIASKHSAGVISAAAFVAVGALPWFERRMTGKSVSAEFLRWHKYTLAAAVLMAGLVAVILMPVWWSLPQIIMIAGLIGLMLVFGFDVRGRARRIAIGGTAAIFILNGIVMPVALFHLVETPIEVIVRRGGLMRMQAEDTSLRLDSLGERTAMLVKETYFAGTQYFEDPPWATFESIQAQIRAYEDARLDGRGGGITWGMLIVALNALGGVWLARHRYQGTALLMMCWLLIPALALIMNPLAWQRYYIIIHAPVAVLAGLGLRQIATSLQTLFEKPLSPVLPPQTEEGVRR